MEDEFSHGRLKHLLELVKRAEIKVREERAKCNHEWRGLKQEYNIYTSKCDNCGSLKIDEY